MKVLRSLLRDGWVIGIACAAALAYTTIDVLDEMLTIFFSIVDGVPAELYEGTAEGEAFAPREFFSYDVVVNGHIILLEPLLRAVALFTTTVVGSALALYATRSDNQPGSESEA